MRFIEQVASIYLPPSEEQLRLQKAERKMWESRLQKAEKAKEAEKVSYFGFLIFKKEILIVHSYWYFLGRVSRSKSGTRRPAITWHHPVWIGCHYSISPVRSSFWNHSGKTWTLADIISHGSSACYSNLPCVSCCWYIYVKCVRESDAPLYVCWAGW